MRKAAQFIRTTVVTLGLLAGLLVGVSASSAEAAPASPKSSRSMPYKGEAFTLRGDIGPNVKRTVTLRVWHNKHWKKIATTKTDKRGKYRFSIRTSSNSIKVRVVAPKARIHGRTYGKLKSRYRVIHTVKQTATLDVSRLVPVAEKSTVKATFNPWIAGRPVELQEKVGSDWVTVETGVEDNYGYAAFAYTPAKAGTTYLRTVAKAHGKAPQKIGDAAAVTAVNDAHESATQVVVGSKHSCALTSSGTVKCWGSNSDNQLGGGTAIGTDRYSDYPSKVVGLPAAAVSLAAGSTHTCAVLEDHSLWCWGYNGYGQLGDQTRTQRSAPVKVKGLSNVISVTAGVANTCAVVGATPTATSGAAKCWGNNENGVLGSGTTKSELRLTPTTVTGLSSDVVSLSMGMEHACAVTTAGTAKCWGVGINGELGNGTTKSSTVPVTVKNLSGATTVEAGLQDACATTAAGAVWCWGGNRVTTSADHTVASQLPNLTGGIDGVALGNISCLIEDGAAKCWGINKHGELGDGTKTTRSAPTAVVGLSSGVVSLATNFDWWDTHSCAALSSGAVQCWGGNEHGELGAPIGTTGITPVSVRDFG